MKTIIFAFILFPSFLIAQIDLPPSSPDASWTHQLGFAQINLSYARPQMRGRKIFGTLVPYDQIWRTGAGESTRIKFTEDIFFGGNLIPKGQYAIYSIPGKEDWTIILNSDVTLHGDFGYDEKKDVLRIKIRPDFCQIAQESFTIDLTDFKSDYSANLQLGWENTIVKIPILSGADSKIMAQIKESLIAQKSENGVLLNKAAQYYFVQKRDLNQALLWSQRSEASSVDNFNYVQLTTKILEELQRYPDAIKSAGKAVEIGKKKNMVEEIKHLQAKISEWETKISK